MRATARLVDGAPGEPVELGSPAKRRATRSSRSGGIDAVVVRERDEIGGDAAPAPRSARGRARAAHADADELERAVARERLVEAVVVVLVDEQDPEGAVRLRARANPAAAPARSTRSTVATTRSNDGSSLGATAVR